MKVINDLDKLRTRLVKILCRYVDREKAENIADAEMKEVNRMLLNLSKCENK